MYPLKKLNINPLNFIGLLSNIFHALKISASVYDTDTSCYNISNYFPLIKVDENLKFAEKTIFFLETSCHGCLNSRQACSVESAATANPDWDIFVLVLGPISQNCKIGKIYSFLSTERNVKFARINVTEFVKGSKVEILFTRNIFALSKDPVVHNADVLRILVLNKLGGLYLDLDVIVMKSFNDLPKNFVVREYYGHITSGILRFSDRVGKLFMDIALEELRKKFRPWLWNENGPGLIKRLLERICFVNLPYWSAKYCQGIEVFHAKYFYPVEPDHWLKYYRDVEVDDSIAYTHHVWNQQGEQEEIKPNVLYKRLAENYCPKIHKMFGDTFGYDTIRDVENDSLSRYINVPKWY